MDKLNPRVFEISDQLTYRLGLAIDWFLISGIQNGGLSDNKNGGVHAWYDPARFCYPFVYLESTGYALSLNCLLFKIMPSKGEIFLSYAKSAYNWLKTSTDGDLFYHSYQLPIGSFDQRKFSFDSAICGKSLIDYYQIFQEFELLQMISTIAYRLLSLELSRGTIAPVIPPNLATNKWSEIFYIHHAKLAVFFLSAKNLLKDNRFQDFSINICDNITRTQEQTGFFRKNAWGYFLHPHCYACEGLLFAGRILDEPRYEGAAIRGIELLARLQHEDGTFPRVIPDDGESTLDVIAQAIQLWSILDPQKYKESINKAVQALLRLQYTDGPKEVKGGFPYSTKTNHVNSWVTIFAINAMLGLIHGATIDNIL